MTDRPFRDGDSVDVQDVCCVVIYRRRVGDGEALKVRVKKSGTEVIVGPSAVTACAHARPSCGLMP